MQSTGQMAKDVDWCFLFGVPENMKRLSRNGESIKMPAIAKATAGAWNVLDSNQ